MTENVNAYPLCWPHGRPRLQRYSRERSKFETTFARARDEVIRQIELLVGKYPSQQREAAIAKTIDALRGSPAQLSGNP